MAVCENPANAFQEKKPSVEPAATSQSQTYEVSPVDRVPEAPVIADASNEGDLAISTFKYPENLKVQLFAAEPDVANPVALHVDNRGRVYVCETFRQEYGVEDNRNHSNWLDADLKAQTVRDRVDYILKYENDAVEKYTARDDRIRLLTDTDRDGVADKSQVFSDRYNAIADGTGAGVLSVGNDVYYTNIPHLWKLTDTDADGIADVRKSLIKGFGVRFAFRGHDLHGLIVGPDHRLYFSVGDRGYNVSPEIHDATSGAVFSCELDGSDLQVFATGLRNPQELAFDDYGNLFTGDNNSDSGDKARWVYVVPGGDSGWRMYYQYLPDRGPFNRERIWEPYNEDTPAYIVPPIANIGDGPSGIAFYPGTGLSNFFNDRFFYCDFRGVANVSGVRTFKLKPKGAGFEVTDMDQTLWNTLPTDIDFGPDGKVYVSDWVFGWQGEGKGRIYTYHDPKVIESDLVKETKTILANGVAKENEERLVELMGHADRRVRMAAQFELVKRESATVLLKVACENKGKDLDVPYPDRTFRSADLRRLHALWGWQRLASKGLAGRSSLLLREVVVALCGEPEREINPVIRAQAIKMAGELGITGDEVTTIVRNALKDEDSRVRFWAAMSLGKIGAEPQLGAILKMLDDNNDKDPYLRHAGIMGMAGIMARDRIAFEFYLPSIQKKSKAVRLAFVAAARRNRQPLIYKFLDDPDVSVVKEAARAIHDLPIRSAISSLASLIKDDPLDDAIVRRVLNANVIVGGEDNALQLAKFASRPGNYLQRRIDALELLRKWENPDPRAYVLGDWRPISTGERNVAHARVALEKLFERIVSKSPVAAKTVEVCAGLNCKIDLKKLATFASDSNSVEPLRIASLKALGKLDSANHQDVVLQLASNLKDLTDELSTVVIEQLVLLDKQKAIDVLQQVVESDSASVLRKQLSYKTLGEISDQRAAEILASSLDRLAKGEIKSSVALDLVSASEKRSEASVKSRLGIIADGSNKYKFVLEGGNAERGAKIFYEKTEVYCTRCHLIDDWGGAVGPELSEIGKQKDRKYLLQSIIDPNAVIAEGFSQTIILTDEGDTFTGIIKEQDDSVLTLMDSDGKLIRVAKDIIEGQKTGKSSMPEDLVKHLSKSELRDLIEFLAGRVEKTTSNKSGEANTEHK